MTVNPETLRIAIDAAHKSGNTNPVQVAHIAAALEAVLATVTPAATDGDNHPLTDEDE